MRALQAGAAAICLISAYVWFAAWPALMSWVAVFLSPELLESRDYVSLEIHESFTHVVLKTPPPTDQASKGTSRGWNLSGPVKTHECSTSQAGL